MVHTCLGRPSKPACVYIWCGVKRDVLSCANSEDSDQPACKTSLFGLNFISFVYQHMSNDIYKQAYMIYKTGFRRKSVDLFESVSHFALAK